MNCYAVKGNEVVGTVWELGASMAPGGTPQMEEKFLKTVAAREFPETELYLAENKPEKFFLADNHRVVHPDAWEELGSRLKTRTRR